MESLGTLTAMNDSISMEKINKSNTQYQYKKLFPSVFSMAAFTVYLPKENKHPWQSHYFLEYAVRIIHQKT